MANLKSADVIKYMHNKFPGIKVAKLESDFRNDKHAGKIKPAKTVRNGKTNILFFSKASVDDYAKFRALMYGKKSDAKPGKAAKSKRGRRSRELTQFGLPIDKDHITIFQLVGITEEDLRQKLMKVVDKEVIKIKAGLTKLKSSVEI